MNISNKSEGEIIEILTEIANNFDHEKENYLKSYPYFINYFKNNNPITLESLIIGISFTYSWMPTILKSLKLDNPEKITFILNEVKKGKLLNNDELLILKKAFNNSLVGTSKLLHFINPEKYAIWDSKVFRFLYNEEPHKYKLEKPELYLEYLDFIKALIAEKSFDNFYTLMKKNVAPK